MATSKEFHDYIVENLQKAGKVTTRKMSLLLKPTETVLRLMPDAKRAYPYEGSRTLMVAVEDVENTELMTKVLNGMYKELPKPKRK
ncbi:MAG: competence protein TfoX [Dorea sp.]|uniref:competence protein TfoX n=1 Tax=Sporofaciens sp. JLR.KK001 TaxID=3112621 RepID=UPI002173109A|nr:competence protein TfoX [Dorea sp.]MCI9618819.1 competence protein TfoX [Dorea sp.]